MAYTTQSEIEAEIPAQLLTRALDDNGDGQADAGVLTQIIANASRDVDARLEGLYEVPFADTAPAIVREAAFVFACETIYARRRQSAQETNPYTERADKLRTTLEKIGAGELPLRLSTEDPIAADQGSAVTAVPTRTSSRTE